MWLFVLLLLLSVVSGAAVGYASAAALRGRGLRFVAIGSPFTIIGVAVAIPVDLAWPLGIVVGITVALAITGLEVGLAAYTIRHGIGTSQPQHLS